MRIEGSQRGLKGGHLSLELSHSGHEGAEDGNYRGFPERYPFDVPRGHDWKHGTGEVWREFAGTGDEVDEGPNGLIVRGGSHHSTRVV